MILAGTYALVALVASAASFSASLSASISVVPAASLSASFFSAVFARLIPFEVANVLVFIVNFYVILIIIWAVLSWFQGRVGFLQEIRQVLDKIVGPFVKIFRKIIPTTGGLDFSPFIAIIILQLLIRLLVGL